MELFQIASSEKPQLQAPLAARMAPVEWSDFVGQDHLVHSNCPLYLAIEKDQLASSIFFGPPGTGKTALARMAARKSHAAIEYLNAVTAGVADIRKVVKKAVERKQIYHKKTLLIIDEIHHFNRSQQDALLPDVERGNLILVGLTTENPHFYVNAALMSRSTAFEFKTLSEESLKKILQHTLEDKDKGLGAQNITLLPEAETHLLRAANGDARRLLNHLEWAVQIAAPSQKDTPTLTLDLSLIEKSSQRRSIRYDKKGDEHYDTISAFIKSLRGSNPDAALYWMAKMIKAGEDPRFIARRMMIFAAEDVGNAEPQALSVSVAASEICERVGMPEARIPLAQAATYLATCPKSNASYVAITRALDEVENGPERMVPNHLKDSSKDKQSLGHGKDYQYPHEFPGHFVEQEYMPTPKIFYTPSDQGQEKEIANRLETWRKSK